MSHDARLPFQRRLLPDGYGAVLRSAREGVGATRREVASAVAIAPRTLARIEREQQKPIWPTLERLCDHLGVSVSAVSRRWLADSFDVPASLSSAPGLGLRALRRELGVTLVALAGRSGISAATLSRFERGLTGSRLLARRDGGPEIARDDRDVVLASEPLAAALGFEDSAALRRACASAFAKRGAS